MLKTAPTLAIVAVDTAENEPPKVYESPPPKFLFKARQLLLEFLTRAELCEIATLRMFLLWVKSCGNFAAD